MEHKVNFKIDLGEAATAGLFAAGGAVVGGPLGALVGGAFGSIVYDAVGSHHYKIQNQYYK